MCGRWRFSGAVDAIRAVAGTRCDRRFASPDWAAWKSPPKARTVKRVARTRREMHYPSTRPAEHESLGWGNSRPGNHRADVVRAELGKIEKAIEILRRASPELRALRRLLQELFAGRDEVAVIPSHTNHCVVGRYMQLRFELWA